MANALDPRKPIDVSIEIELTVRRGDAYGACHYHFPRDSVRKEPLSSSTSALQRAVAEALLIALKELEKDENG